MSDTFERHEMTGAAEAASASIREAAADLEAVIRLRCCPGGRKKLAVEKLEECVMWANKSLAIDGAWEESHE